MRQPGDATKSRRSLTFAGSSGRTRAQIASVDELRPFALEAVGSGRPSLAQSGARCLPRLHTVPPNDSLPLRCDESVGSAVRGESVVRTQQRCSVRLKDTTAVVDSCTQSQGVGIPAPKAQAHGKVTASEGQVVGRSQLGRASTMGCKRANESSGGDVDAGLRMALALQSDGTAGALGGQIRRAGTLRMARSKSVLKTYAAFEGCVAVRDVGNREPAGL